MILEAINWAGDRFRPEDGWIAVLLMDNGSFNDIKWIQYVKRIPENGVSNRVIRWVFTPKSCFYGFTVINFVMGNTVS